MSGHVLDGVLASVQSSRTRALARLCPLLIRQRVRSLRCAKYGAKRGEISRAEGTPSRIKSANIIAENTRCRTRGREFRAITVDLSLFQRRRHQLGHLDIVAAATYARAFLRSFNGVMFARFGNGCAFTELEY